MESALHRNVEALSQGNRDALQESTVSIFASKALFLDPKGICPPGPSHTAIQNRSNSVCHQPLLRYKTLDAVLDSDENCESSSEIMQSSKGIAKVLR